MCPCLRVYCDYSLNLAIVKKHKKVIEFLIEKGIYDEDVEVNPFLKSAEIDDTETTNWELVAA